MNLEQQRRKKLEEPDIFYISDDDDNDEPIEPLPKIFCYLCYETKNSLGRNCSFCKTFCCKQTCVWECRYCSLSICTRCVKKYPSQEMKCNGCSMIRCKRCKEKGGNFCHI